MNPNNYRTRDLYFSAYLIVAGVSFVGIDFDVNGNFFWFVFEDLNTCTNLENTFSVGASIPDVSKYAQNVRYLKKLVSENNGNYQNSNLNKNEEKYFPTR